MSFKDFIEALVIYTVLQCKVSELLKSRIEKGSLSRIDLCFPLNQEGPLLLLWHYHEDRLPLPTTGFPDTAVDKSKAYEWVVGATLKLPTFLLKEI